MPAASAVEAGKTTAAMKNVLVAAPAERVTNATFANMSSILENAAEIARQAFIWYVCVLMTRLLTPYTTNINSDIFVFKNFSIFCAA